ncbi:MAG: MoaD/ThiS family protein [Desulfobacterium sp.]|nr:MoaD/ThiS family protein [Desulfobacterium sp.]
MPTITFNAFSFLQKKLKKKNIKYTNVAMELACGTTPNDLIKQLELTKKDVEVVFINGKVAPFNTILHHGDRVALVPHGTPGPYRVFLGFKNKDMT